MLTQIRSLHGPWRFQPAGQKQTFPITIPSQWSHGPCWGYPPRWADVEQAWCSRQVSIPADWQGLDIRLRFDAVMLRAEVYADAALLGSHTGGFTPFEIDVSHLVGRTFQLRVRVSSVKEVMPGTAYTWQVSYGQDHEEGPIARGIWQNVWLVARPPVHISQFHYTTRLKENRIRIEAWMENRGNVPFRGSLAMVLKRSARAAADDVFLPARPVKVPAHGRAKITFARPVGKLPLWSEKDPVLLPGELLLRDLGKQTVHRLPVRLGLREVRMGQDQLLVNDHPVRLRGLSLVRHRISPHLWRRDYLTLFFRTLKGLGFNAVRAHGCIAPPVVFDVADEVGLLVEAQSSLWSATEDRYWAGGAQFLANVLNEFREWIPRDWNHPSIVIWDAENEQVHINERQIPNTKALIALTRELDPSRPVVASGSGAFDAVDLQHLHGESRLDVVLDHWRANPYRKPMIAGEWFGVCDIRGLVCMMGVDGGIGGPQRLIHDFAGVEDIDRALARIYSFAFRAYRSRGIAASIFFCPELYLFDPLFRPGQPIHVAATEKEPVAIPYAETHDSSQMVAVRRPYVNPGWAPDLPALRLNPRITPSVKRALSPLAAAFREYAASARPGRATRTLVLVNDTGHPVRAKLRITAGAATLFTGRFPIREGGLLERRIHLTIPDRLAGRIVAMKAVLHDGPKRFTSDLGELKVFPRPQRRVMLALPLALTGVPEAIRQYLRRRGISYEDQPHNPPAAPAVWLVGNSAEPQREAVIPFLQQGGRIILLRQQSWPQWLPALLSFQSSLKIHAQHLRGYGFPAMGHERSGVLWAPRTAEDHPVFRGLPLGPELGPWTAADGRVADDVFRKDCYGQTERAGHLVPLASGKFTEHVALAELAVGPGKLIFCQLALAENLAVDDAEATAIFDRLLVHAAAALPAKGSLSGDDSPLVRQLRRRFPHAADCSANASLHVLTDPPRIRQFLRQLDDPSHAPDAFLERGGHVLCVLPPDVRRLGHWFLTRPKPRRLITSFVSRPPLLCGWNAADLDFWDSGTCAHAVLPAETKGSSWRDAIMAFELPSAGPRGGISLGERLGSLFKWRPAGSGTVCLTTLALDRFNEPAVVRRWEALLANTGVALPVDQLRPSSSITHLSVLSTPEMPLDGDYLKWANTRHDKAVSPWTRAVPLVLGLSAKMRGKAPLDLRRHAALGYLLHSQQCLYAAAIVVAPQHKFHDDQPVYEYSDMELFVGPTQICVGQDTRGQPRYYFHGSSLRAPGEAALRSRITLLDPVPPWPDISLLNLGDRAGLKTCFFELAVPWAVLDMPRPKLGDELPVALQVCIHDANKECNRLQLVSPLSFEYEQPTTYARARLDR